MSSPIYRAMTVEELAKVLGTIPEGSWLTPNSVHNLAVFDDDGKYLGYVDFRVKRFVTMVEEEAE